MDTISLLKQVRKIEIKTRRLSDHLFSGEYHSSFKGRGIAFSEVRPYQFGDDVRTIDWQVTARKNEPYIKVFEEERELTLLLLVDVSGSEFFGSHGQLKKDMITEICATLAFSAIQNNDKVGVLFFSDRIEKFIPPKKGKQHTLHIIRELLELKPVGKGSDISVALETAVSVLKKKSIFFLLSDFQTKDYSKALKIAARKHDVTGIRVYDKWEEKLPRLGMLQLFDLEEQHIEWVNTSSSSVRKKHHETFMKFTDRFKTSFSRSGAGHFSVRTDQDYVKKMLGYFKTRHKA